MRLIKAVTFDLWNTLLSEKNYDNFRIRYLTNVLGEQGIFRGSREIRQAYMESHRYAHRISEQENCRYISAEQRLDRILAQLKVSLPRDARSALVKGFQEAVLNDPPELVKDARGTLESLSPKYKLGIICDAGITPGKVMRSILAELRILNFFSSTVFSDELGFNKPHRLMFKTALRELHVEPSEAVHVGDLLETDIAGAKSVGMAAVWFTRKEPAKIDLPSPDFEVHALPQIVEILKEQSLRKKVV